MIRGFRHEVKGHGTRHSTEVDCLYFDFSDGSGRQVLQLSTDAVTSQRGDTATLSAFPGADSADAEPTDAIDLFVSRAALTSLEDVGLDGSPARRRAVARDSRPLVGGGDAVPIIDPAMVDALKFSAALPPDLATRTLGERLADRDAAAMVARGSTVRAG